MSAGIKHDNTPDKNLWQLAPWDAFRAIVRVFAFGAAKYAPRNWELGIAYGRVYRAAIDHLSKWWLREDEGKGPGVDPETGFSHRWHAGCCVCFLIAYEIRGVLEIDDRPATHSNVPDPPKAPAVAEPAPQMFAIGSAAWPGLSKLAEEAGEALQVIGKLMGTGGATAHWDGSDLRARLIDEVADLRAACDFVTDANNLALEVSERSKAKLALFWKWHGPAQLEPDARGHVVDPVIEPECPECHMSGQHKLQCSRRVVEPVAERASSQAAEAQREPLTRQQLGDAFTEALAHNDRLAAAVQQHRLRYETAESQLTEHIKANDELLRVNQGYASQLTEADAKGEDWKRESEAWTTQSNWLARRLTNTVQELAEANAKLREMTALNVAISHEEEPAEKLGATLSGVPLRR